MLVEREDDVYIFGSTPLLAYCKCFIVRSEAHFFQGFQSVLRPFAQIPNEASSQVTKLVRANKFVLDTVMYKVGEDAISDAFSRAADAADNTQVGFLSSVCVMIVGLLEDLFLVVFAPFVCLGLSFRVVFFSFSAWVTERSSPAFIRNR